MAITLTQTDTDTGTFPAGSIGGCSITPNGQTSSKIATSGGTAGTGTVNLTHDASASQLCEVQFISAAGEPNSTSWEGGSATYRLEVTTANMQLTWDQVKHNAGTTGINCFSALGISLGSTGVKSTTQTLSASAGRNAVDRITTTYVLVSSNSMATQAWAYKPSQNIDTPINQVTSAPPQSDLLFAPIGRGMGIGQFRGMR